MQDIYDRYRKFREELFPERRQLFRRSLKDKQSPDMLLITCSDSRIAPDLFLGAAPGDVFVVRNAGNIVPAYSETQGAGVAASVEYAVTVLKVKSLVICGHSDCGAMKAVMHPEKAAHLPAVSAWLRNSDTARAIVSDTKEGRTEEQLLDNLIQENVLAQLEHVQTHPSVMAAYQRGELNLYGWVYKIRTGEIFTYDGQGGRFVPLDGSMPVATRYANPQP